MGLLTYNPREVTISLAGIYHITGFVNGTFVKIEKETKPYEHTTSMDGEVARLYTKNNNFKITLSLSQSSPSNNILSALHSVDLATHKGKFPVLISDHSGTSKFFTTNAWIETFPVVAFGNSHETREWVIQCSNGVLAVGGNDMGTTSDIASLLSLAPEVMNILGGS